MAAEMSRQPALAVLVLLPLLCARGLHGQRDRPEPPFRFTDSAYNATIYENSAARTYVQSHHKMGIFVAGPAVEVKYKIVSGDEENVFKAEELVVGDFCFLRVRTKGGNSATLNREVRDRYTLTVKAAVKNGHAEAFVRVFVQVIDLNDLRPLFLPTAYSASIGDDTPARTSVLRVTATDADVGPNGRFYYSFAQRTDAFAVHPTSGVVTLARRLTEHGDVARHELDVLAVDRGGLSSSARLAVHVGRANAHAPLVAAATALVPSPSDADPLYAVLAVEDGDAGPDGEIEAVDVVAGDPLKKFSVSPMRGNGGLDFGVKLTGEVDWAAFPFGVNLTVQARDRGKPPKYSPLRVVTVRGPRTSAVSAFHRSVYRGSVKRCYPPQAAVLMVKASSSTERFKYVIQSGADSSFFNINPTTGLIAVDKSIAAVEKDHFELDIGTDVGSGVTKVIINITDTNDKAPVFDRPAYSAALSENIPVGTFVLGVHATDRDKGENGYVTYSIANVNPVPFSVHPYSGNISTAGPVDYELMSQVYSLRVRASDWGTPYRREAEAIVTVSVTNLNDNAPIFEKVDCVGTLPRDVRLGEQIATVSAIDMDELQLVRYEFVSGNEQDLFHLHADSGVLTLKRALTDIPIGSGAYRLKVTATDGERFAEPMFLNISVVNAPGAVPSLECKDTGIAKRLAERLHQAGKLRDKLRSDDSFTDTHNVNLHAPAFDASRTAAVEVREDLPIGAEVMQIEAKDLDSGFNGKLVYALSGGNDLSNFVIDTETGVLSVLLPLDREAVDSHLLNITAYDLGIPQRAASTSLKIVVLDANDNRPEFSKRTYQVNVSESAQPGRKVLQLEAVDRDEGDNGAVRYRLLSDTDKFRVDGETGVLELSAALDRERRPEHTLLVEALDQARTERRRSSVATVIVKVDDVNDNPPACVPPTFRFRVLEDVPVGALLGWLDAHDPDLGPGGQVRFSLREDDDEGGGERTFEVDRTSGALRLARRLDFETRQFYNLTLRLRDRDASAPLSSSCQVEVEVVDVDENEHAPLFSRFVADCAVPEDAPVGSHVLTVEAADEDEGMNGEVRYSIRNGSGLGVFNIHPETGAIGTAQLLDRETASRYWLMVYATDRAVIPRFSTLHVYVEVQDVNDNAPQTSEPIYLAAVAENSPKDVPVVRVDAWDPDTGSGEGLKFRIVSGNPQGFFAINSSTGVINTTARKLDRETQSEHNLEVSIVDGGEPPLQTTARVVVRVSDENDNAPQFVEKRVQVKALARERSVAREAVCRVYARDADHGANAELSYSIDGGNEAGKFFIDPKDGVISTRNPCPVGTYDFLTIKVVDNGRPLKSSLAKLDVDWIARPDPPQTPVAFTESLYAVSIIEIEPVGFMLLVLPTQPINGLRWFDITGGNVDNKFHIKKHTGTLELAKNLDAERMSFYNLTVMVTDGTNSAMTQVEVSVINTNEHRPQFSRTRYEVSVSEETPPNTEILRLNATDRDDTSSLTFSIVSSTDVASLRKFKLDYNTGALSTVESLDHETKQSHILTVMVRDSEIPVQKAYATVVVNVRDSNDHAPLFTSRHYEGRVVESAALGSAVLEVVALDRDRGPNAEVTYSIEAGNVGNSFTIHPTMGILSVAKELDRAVVEAYELALRAVDRGEPPRSATAAVRVLVTVADNAPPKFASKDYSAEVSEGARPGSFVLMVTASSRSTVNYEIRDGNFEDTFYVNPTSGVITTKELLDYERKPSYQLTIQATNMVGLSTNASVSIHLSDENDNAPVFDCPQYRGVVSEEAQAHTVVLNGKNVPLVIRATDLDSEQNSLLVYQIVEHEAQTYFSIDSSTGAIKMIKVLDHEKTPEFHFQVRVSDSGSPKLSAETPANVTITVLDANDSPPIFSRAVYETVLLTPTYSGVRLLSMSATDPDTDASLTFSISTGNVGDKFAINARTGDISVQNATHLRSRYELAVKVFDGKFVSTAQVKVSVREISTGELRVPQTYSASVPENSTEVVVLAVIAAVGSGVNEPLTYSVLNPSGMFEIKPTAGILQTTGVPFDREKQERYEVLVEVRSDARARPNIAHAVVTVCVEDVNDNAPIFVNLPYYAVVEVDAAPGSVVYTIAAVDRDVGRNGEVSYSLKEEHEYFDVEARSGDVSLRRSFTADMSSKDFTVNVVATDSGVHPLSSEVSLPVTVINKAMPIFERPFYSKSVPENIKPHTPILNLQAKSPEGLPLIFSITDGDPFNQFSIDFNTGVVNVIGSLDHETQTTFKLTVRATDSVTGSHAEVNLDILVQDVNDNPPLFSQSAYATTLSEAALIGISVLQVSATDADIGSNKALYYQIINNGKNSSECFYIDSSSGLILTSRFLDYEQNQVHNFLVRASDSGMPFLTSDVPVTITVTDINDNPPVFNQLLYEAFVSELAPRGHFVTRVQASDADASDTDKLEYSILSGNDHMNFVVDSKSGIISISNLRKQTLAPQYRLNISVSDGVFTSTAQVHVNIQSANLHSPIFGQNEYVKEIPENSEVGTLLTLVQATDKDWGPLGHVSYSIVNQFAGDRFTIDENGQIFTSEPLDREDPLERVFDINIMAKDGGGRVGFTTVKVIATDENDNKPTFVTNEYFGNVLASADKGTAILQVLATDPDEGSNADLVYTLYKGESDSAEDVLEVQPLTGHIVTKESLVGLEGSRMSFFVKAEDKGPERKHSVVPVSVSVLPADAELPAFTEAAYALTVAEDAEVGSEIGAARLAGNDSATYAAVPGGGVAENNADDTFVVLSQTGRLKVAKALDHETVRSYRFGVKATYRRDEVDVVAQVLVTVHVGDVNDNRPVFESSVYEGVVMENLPAGVPVVQVRATDRDGGANGQLAYSLAEEAVVEGGAARDLFSVDAESGWVRTLRPLDREARAGHELVVVATDLGDPARLSATASVRVAVADANDCPPRFSRDTYAGDVPEDSAPGQVVAVVGADDADATPDNGQLTYYLTGGDPLGQFAIGYIQGEWKLHLKQPVDREERDRYQIEVTATDGAFVSKAVVDVAVLDANDNSPVCDKLLYAVAVAEDVAPGIFLLLVSARDADVGANAAIQYTLHGPGAEHFRMDSATGELFTLAPLDREAIPAYALSVRATDGGGRSCQAEILVSLEDVNDNAPQFPASHYAVSVYESTAVETLLTRVQATDSDLGLNRKVTYSFLDSAGGHFAIDERSGIISLKRPLDREHQAVYELTVRAEDGDVFRPLTSTVGVSVAVLDVNDNPPAFEQREYHAAAPEDTAPGSAVLSVLAISKDAGANAEVTYGVVSGNEHGMFSIDQKLGVISVEKALDYETSRDYYLTVQASDGGTPSLSGVVTVNINVTDVNDNAPEFSRHVYSAVVGEDALPGDTIITVVAEDRDGPLNSIVRYSIVGGDQEERFAVDEVSGTLRVRRELDREKVSGYSLTVRATDNGTPPRSADVLVNVDISDINDNPPSFSEQSYTAVIQENQPPGTSIVRLLVMDMDASHNGPPFGFSFVAGNNGSEFAIDQAGVVTAAVRFASGGRREHLLTVQAQDSGHPHLSSACQVRVRITEESVHPPAIIPLEIAITVPGDAEAPGGVIGKIHATDQDVYDTLTYSLHSDHGRLFAVNSRDGTVIALPGLDPGRYDLNVTVSDGKHARLANVTVRAHRVSAEELNASVVLRLADISPDKFVGVTYPSFQRALRSILNLKHGGIRVLGVQTAAGARQLDVLLVAEKPSAYFYRPALLAQALNASLARLEESTGVRALGVPLVSCAAGTGGCPQDQCLQRAALEDGAVSTHSTARLSLVSPRHRVAGICLCSEQDCVRDPCLTNPCLSKGECVLDVSNPAGFVCVSVVSFAEGSYAEFRTVHDLQDVTLSMHVRSTQNHGVIAYSRGTTDYMILELSEGRPQFRFDCGGGPGSVTSIQPVSDGGWHSLALALDDTRARLTVNGIEASGPLRCPPGWRGPLPADARLYLGGIVRRRSGRSAHGGVMVSSGFRGCLEMPALNGFDLPLKAPSSSALVKLEESVDVSSSCPLDECEPGVECDACASKPCANGGVCQMSGSRYTCSCPRAFTGTRCQVTALCTYTFQCENSGMCKDSQEGPLCLCLDGFTGGRCESDVDECQTVAGGPCSDGGRCLNTYGSYVCNCTDGFGDPTCTKIPKVESIGSWPLSSEELIGIIVFFVALVILAAVFVVFRKRICCRHYADRNIALVQGDPVTASFVGKSYAFPPNGRAGGGQHGNRDRKRHHGNGRQGGSSAHAPPQVPVRPMSYTPSLPGESRGPGEGSQGGHGGEAPAAAAAAAAVHGSRKVVAVCSVAPNLPPPPSSSNPASDSESLQKDIDGKQGGAVPPRALHEADGRSYPPQRDPRLCPRDVPEGEPSAYNPRDSMSEVQSLSSFQSESCDDNASIVEPARSVHRGLTWDTSDWMPHNQLPDIDESGEAPCPEYADPAEIEGDYYLGGYDIDSELPLPEDAYDERFDPLLPLCAVPSTGSIDAPPGGPAAARHRRNFHPSQYLPQHEMPSRRSAGDYGAMFTRYDGEYDLETGGSPPPSRARRRLDASAGRELAPDAELDGDDVDGEGPDDALDVKMPGVVTRHHTQV
ncbi:protocadherin Fat 1-like isoform X2 [Lampetra planeri]